MTDVHFDTLVAELRALRKGRGLFVSMIGERVGPALRQVCGVADADPPADIRRKVAQWLEEASTTLPEDLRVAVAGAFGIDRDSRLPYYQDRVRWVAERLHRDDRTARRRIDEAIDRIADLAISALRDTPADNAGPAALAWHTQALRVTLALDRPGPEAIEFRRIIADEDGLDELDLAWSVNASGKHGGTPDDVAFDVFDGGTLVRRRRESTTRVGLALQLPHRLNLGQSHDLMLRYRIEPGHEVQPHYVCVPKHQCEVFDLHVRFDSARRPRRVERLAGVFQRDVTDPMVSVDAVEVDSAGEAHATFRQLTPGMAYGLRWEF